MSRGVRFFTTPVHLTPPRLAVCNLYLTPIMFLIYDVSQQKHTIHTNIYENPVRLYKCLLLQPQLRCNTYTHICVHMHEYTLRNVQLFIQIRCTPALHNHLTPKQYFPSKKLHFLLRYVPEYFVPPPCRAGGGDVHTNW